MTPGDYNQHLKELEEFSRIQQALGSEQDFSKKILGVTALANTWKATVDSGRFYSGSLFDWDRAMAVRELIEKLLHHEEVQRLDSLYEGFKNSIEKSDEQLKEITTEIYQRRGRKFWWERRILKFGVGEYEEHVRQFYGINTEEYFS